MIEFLYLCQVQYFGRTCSLGPGYTVQAEKRETIPTVFVSRLICTDVLSEAFPHLHSLVLRTYKFCTFKYIIMCKHVFNVHAQYLDMLTHVQCIDTCTTQNTIYMYNMNVQYKTAVYNINMSVPI